jgi:hypothetical protein
MAGAEVTVAVVAAMPVAAVEAIWAAGDSPAIRLPVAG